MSNEHLVPIVVLELIRSMKTGTQPEKFYIESRLRAIMEACQAALPKEPKDKK